ncbi:DUF2007 domain-containing protein [Polaribacter sp.]|nr:DUF2007 domain-containing protein [Polaribacter sp.]
MTEDYTKVFIETTLLVKRLETLLSLAKINSRIKSGKIPAYEITNYIDELFILNKDLEQAQPIIEAFKLEINS